MLKLHGNAQMQNDMFIKKITIKNFRLFPSDKDFEIDNINTPDGTNEGSGLNVFVGENGSGKKIGRAHV